MKRFKLFVFITGALLWLGGMLGNIILQPSPEPISGWPLILFGSGEVLFLIGIVLTARSVILKDRNLRDFLRLK